MSPYHPVLGRAISLHFARRLLCLLTALLPTEPISLSWGSDQSSNPSKGLTIPWIKLCVKVKTKEMLHKFLTHIFCYMGTINAFRPCGNLRESPTCLFAPKYVPNMALN